MIIAAPHRGHAHVARVEFQSVASVASGAGAAVRRSRVRIGRGTRAVRQVLARAHWRMRTKPRGSIVGRSVGETPWR